MYDTLTGYWRQSTGTDNWRQKTVQCVITRLLTKPLRSAIGLWALLTFVHSLLRPRPWYRGLHHSLGWTCFPFTFVCGSDIVRFSPTKLAVNHSLHVSDHWKLGDLFRCLHIIVRWCYYYIEYNSLLRIISRYYYYIRGVYDVIFGLHHLHFAYS